jgi:lipase
MQSTAYLPNQEFLIPVTGGNLSLSVYGKLGGIPVLAIHGATSNNRAWQCFARTLNSHGYTIFAPDMRGRGHSNLLPAPFGMENKVKDLIGALDYLELESVDVIGHSMGAFEALVLTEVAPERVNRTVLIDGGVMLSIPPGISLDELIAYVLGPALEKLKMRFESKEQYRESFKVQPAFIKGWSAIMDEYCDYDLQGQVPNLYSRANAQAVIEDSRAQFQGNLIDDALKNLKREVLLIRAERGMQNQEGGLYPEEILRERLVAYPMVKLVTVPDVNHYDIVIEQSGANRCIQIIYGIGG